MIKLYNVKQKYKYKKFKLLEAFGFNVLGTIFVSPSYKCQCNCVHCYEVINNERIKEELSTYEVKKIINNFLKVGGHSINFVSGEFLLRNDALGLIKFACSKGLKTTILSNGLLLDKKKIKSLKKAGIHTIGVSIDSADSKIHDKLRGVKGCFRRAINGIKYSVKEEIYTIIWTYISKSNYKKLLEIVKLGERIKVNKIIVVFPIMIGKWYNNFKENLSFEEREHVRNKFKDNPLVDLEFPIETHLCGAGGRKFISILPTGDVTPCPPLPYSYGNIKKENLKIILRRMRNEFKKYSAFTGQCMSCNLNYRRENENRIVKSI